MRRIPGAERWRLVSIQGLHRFYQRRDERRGRELDDAAGSRAGDRRQSRLRRRGPRRRGPRVSGRAAPRVLRLLAGRRDDVSRRRGVGAHRSTASSPSAATCRPSSTRAGSARVGRRCSVTARATSGIHDGDVRARRPAAAGGGRDRAAARVRRRPRVVRRGRAGGVRLSSRAAVMIEIRRRPSPTRGRWPSCAGSFARRAAADRVARRVHRAVRARGCAASCRPAARGRRGSRSTRPSSSDRCGCRSMPKIPNPSRARARAPRLPVESLRQGRPTRGGIGTRLLEAALAGRGRRRRSRRALAVEAERDALPAATASSHGGDVMELVMRYVTIARCTSA